jgi:hypothetical protein
MSVNFYQTRRRNNPEHSHLRTRCRSILKSHTVCCSDFYELSIWATYITNARTAKIYDCIKKLRTNSVNVKDFSHSLIIIAAAAAAATNQPFVTYLKLQAIKNIDSFRIRYYDDPCTLAQYAKPTNLSRIFIVGL